MARSGLVIAAPGSGSGKTLITIALLRALGRKGLAISGAKSGPDYIDPQFHEAATGISSINLDGWAMSPETLLRRAADQPGDYLLIEGAMGVLDGAGLHGTGSAGDLAQLLKLPVLMVIDAARQAQSAVLPVVGLRSIRPDIEIAGVVLNRIGSEKHREMIMAACARAGIRVLGAIPRDSELTLPERHLGLVQAREQVRRLGKLIEHAASIIAQHCDLDAVAAAFAPLAFAPATQASLPPLGQRIAIAYDDAFAFIYPHMLSDWRAAGAELHFFSPLADEMPPDDADAIFLPGGYPELHASRLSQAKRFYDAMQYAAKKNIRIYGECGGYMAMGETITDAGGDTYPMLGLLPLKTSFFERKLHLGYRILTPLGNSPWSAPLAAHEFHYATISHEGRAARLFKMCDAFGADHGEAGLQVGTVSGSFAHIIGPAPAH